MTIPLITFQLNLLRQYKTGLFASMIPTLIFDMTTLYSWRLHLISSMFQTVTVFTLATGNVISFKGNFITDATTENIMDLIEPLHQKLQKVSSYEFLGFSRSYLSFSIALTYVILLHTFIFAVIEKLMKEHWVIRETAEKSFRTFLSMVDDNPREIFVVDNNYNILYINK